MDEDGGASDSLLYWSSLWSSHLRQPLVTTEVAAKLFLISISFTRLAKTQIYPRAFDELNFEMER